MEGRGPYHIYDPGGGSEENGSTALERLVEENARLKEKMQGIKSIAWTRVFVKRTVSGAGNFSPSAEESKGGDASIVVKDFRDLEQPPNEDANLLPQLQQLENTLSGCAKEASKDQVFVRMGYMASELKRLASKVHKNEQRTSFLQTLCETLHSENKELRTKLEHDLEQRNQALEKLSFFLLTHLFLCSLLAHALEEALNVQASPPPIFAMEPAGKLPQQELLTQNELLKQQVKIFEEDFQRERSDRERMNEEKEELKQQLEKLQKQLVLTNNQLRASKEDCQREKEEKEKLKKLLKQHKQASGERLHPEPGPGPQGPACPMYQYQYSPPMAHPMYHGYDEWQQIRYPPAMPGEHTQGQNFHHFPPPEYPWRPPCAMARSQNAQPVAGVKPVPKDLEQAGPGLP
ncbi:TNFAIP3-interacting protein 1-like [Acridotheres tristis]